MSSRQTVKKQVAIFLLAVAGTHCLGCVLPPESAGPRVLDQSEAQIIALVRKGRELALAGRYEQSEAYLRSSLQRKSDPVIMNDLGFVLRAQDRHSEAFDLFTSALQIEPYFLQARENLARALYERGDFEGALEHFLLLERDYYGYWRGEPDARLARKFTRADLGVAFQSISVIYAQLGQTGEAICYSKRAEELGAYSFQGHIRFLFTLEELSLAQDLLGARLSERAATDPSLLLDYATILLLRDRPKLAIEAIERALGEIGFVGEERGLALLLRYILAERLNDTNAIYMISQSPGSQFICQGAEVSLPKYWPLRLQEEGKISRKALCAVRS